MFSGYVYIPGDGGNNGINLNNATNSNDSQNRPNSLEGMVDPGGEAGDTTNATYGTPGSFREIPEKDGTLLGSMATSIATGTNLQGANEWEGFRNVFDGILIGGGFNSKTRSLNQVEDNTTSGYSFLGYQSDYKYPNGSAGLAPTTINEPAAITGTGLRNIDGFRLAKGSDSNVGPQISSADAAARYLGEDGS